MARYTVLRAFCILFLLAVPAGSAPAAPPDPALAKKLCEDSRKNAPPEDRALCAPVEFVTLRYAQLFMGPMSPITEKGANVYVPVGTHVMAWDVGPHQFAPSDRPYYKWIEWQGKAKMVLRSVLLAVPFKVEQALVTDPNTGIYSGAIGSSLKRPGAGAVISFTRQSDAANTGPQDKLIVIENGDPVGEIPRQGVRILTIPIPPPVKRYAARPAVAVKSSSVEYGAGSPPVKNVPYGSAFEVYTAPPEIVHNGLLPVVEAGKIAGYAPASELSENPPSAADFTAAIRKQLEAADFTLAAAISEAAGEAYKGNADLQALREALREQTQAAPAPPVIVPGQFANLPKAGAAPAVSPGTIDPEFLKKSFQEQFASAQFKKAVASARMLDRLAKSGMKPLAADISLYYACRGDLARAKDVVPVAGGRVPSGTDWCVTKIDLDGPCAPCAEPAIGAGDPDEEKAHNKNYVIPRQKEVDRYQAWKTKFQQAVPASPRVRLHFENLSGAAIPVQTAFLYHYTYSYPNINNDVLRIESGVRGDIDIRAITIPGLEPGGSVNIWVNVPAYESSVYGLLFAKDARDAALTVGPSPQPQPAIQMGPTPGRASDVTVTPRPGTTGAPLPMEVSTPFRACMCWRQ